MGIGRRGGGVGAIRYAVESGAQVRVTDRGDPPSFRDVVEQFAGTPVEFVLGRHDEADFRWADVVVRNPDVRRDSPYLRIAEEHGADIEMEMTLFPGRVSRADDRGHRHEGQDDHRHAHPLDPARTVAGDGRRREHGPLGAGPSR